MSWVLFSGKEAATSQVPRPRSGRSRSCLLISTVSTCLLTQVQGKCRVSAISQPLSKIGDDIPRIASSSIQIKPSADAILKIDISINDALVVLPLRARDDVAKRVDDGRAAPGNKRILPCCHPRDRRRLGGTVLSRHIRLRGRERKRRLVLLAAAQDNLVAILIDDGLATRSARRRS